MVLNFGHRRDNRRNANQLAQKTRRIRRLRLEPLEDRRLLAAINWVNEGADDFGVVFGAQAVAARNVVHAAIDDWESVIANFNNANANTYNLYLRMATQADVDDYGFGGGSTNVIAGQAPPSAITVVAGKPIQGLVLIGRGADGLGTDYFIDPTPNEHSEFQGDINNAFSGRASSPAAIGQTDLYSLVQAELTHALGITSATNSAYRELIDAGAGGVGGVSLVDTGTLDANALGSGATLWAFNGPSINYLMTDVDGNSKIFPAHTARPHVTHSVLIDNEVVHGNVNLGNAAFSGSTRYLISNSVALILQDTYGYTLAAGGPERQATFYALQDASGDVHVRGQTSDSNDSIIMTSQVAYVQAAVNPGVDVPGTAPFTNGSLSFMTRFVPATVDDIRIDAGDGNDSVLAVGVYAGIGLIQLSGDAGNDTLNASFVTGHVIFLNGGDGNDTLRGGALNDVLVGGNGNDLLYGNGGLDTLFGNVGNDRLYGGNGNDLLWGDEGNDYLYGENDNDQLFAGPGNDFGYGNSGDDILLGDLGNDRLEGGAGNDNINGNAGDDILIGGSTLAAINLFAVDGLDVIGGNEGNDLIIGDNAFGNLPAPSGGAADILRGGDGNDRIYGGLGADQIWGDAGNDLLVGMWGADQMFGGVGDDVMRGNEDDDIMHGDDGNDDMQGNDGSDTLFGGNGNDLLNGNDGNDLLRGEAGNDILLGGDGRDELLAGDGRDLLIGGLHGDRLVGDAGEDLLIAGTTTHDNNDAALRAILAEWTSVRTYTERIQNLRGQANPSFAARANGNRYLRSGIEVQADAGGNVLSGLAGRDWFFLSLGDINDAIAIEALN